MAIFIRGLIAERLQCLRNAFCICFLVAVAASIVRAQENPYFVTYDHHLEEAGTLSIETFTTMGFPKPAESETRKPQNAGRDFILHPTWRSNTA